MPMAMFTQASENHPILDALYQRPASLPIYAGNKRLFMFLVQGQNPRLEFGTKSARWAGRSLGKAHGIPCAFEGALAEKKVEHAGSD